ncbi:E3 ubiquitin-protein ligase ATL31-like [Phragmites australis]|uniref:E3 ubiquitin-protein ligase ATL31-like n=1 Tax=Phragmites australis TaxID=29695 RepID=UPI002D79BE43|nr:E3 ubiquitin-protein ligase ATL31-like [Phragmites australis]
MGPSNGRRLLLLAAVALAGAAVGSTAAQQQGAPSGPGPNYFDPNNFNTSMAIVMVVLVTAFFLLGLFSVYLRRCAGPPLGGPDEYPGAARRPGRGGITYASRSRRLRGLDRALLESFPTMAYADVKAHKAGNGALECAVCLSEFDGDETLRFLPKCSHAFHTDCIDAWLASHVTCPVCRASLVPDADAPAPVVASAVPTTEQYAPAAPQLPAQETATATTPEEVAVVIVDAEETEEERIRREEAAELIRIGSVKRALRSKSGRRPAQFPRSHTTGHSLTAPAPSAAESAERYTLRLPEHVLREVVAAGKLRRSASVQAFWTGGDASARRGFGGTRGGSVRLGQSGRWPNMSLLARTFSARLPAWGSARCSEANAPGKGAKVAGNDQVVEQCDGGACPLGARV